MTFVIEAIIAIIFFTIFVVSSVRKNPISWVDDYPPAIVKRCKELGLINNNDKSRKANFYINKLVKSIIITITITCIVVLINGAKTFFDGFMITYGLWFIVAWYDALVIDCLWFCHDKSIRIKGTEDMDEAYCDYMFHIKMSLRGCLLGIPVSLLVGLFTLIINYLI